MIISTKTKIVSVSIELNIKEVQEFLAILGYDTFVDNNDRAILASDGRSLMGRLATRLQEIIKAEIDNDLPTN